MNPAAIVDYLVGWSRQKVQDAAALGLVLGVSGGVDSAVAAIIAKKAFPDKCMALLLPCESGIAERMDSQALVEKYNIDYRVIDLDNAYNLLSTQFESYLKLEGLKGKLLRGNIKARLRMIALYYSAQARNYLVLGTSNKSELSVGYTTKHGDSGVDLQLLGDLLKREVYELAEFLAVPPSIVNKVPSGGLWSGQTDEEEMGFSYEELDDYLDKGAGDFGLTERIEAMMARSWHKRNMPPIPKIPSEFRVK